MALNPLVLGTAIKNELMVDEFVQDPALIKGDSTRVRYALAEQEAEQYWQAISRALVTQLEDNFEVTVDVGQVDDFDVSAAAHTGAPNSLSAGTVRTQIAELLVDINTLETTYDAHAADGAIHYTVGSIDHGLLEATSLLDDDHTQYWLLAGRSADQVGHGSVDSGGSATLRGTAHATPGPVLLNDLGGNVGVGTSPAHGLDVVGDAFRLQDTLAASTVKYANFLVSNWDTGEEDVLVLSGDSGSAANTNRLRVGGGDASYNCATEIQFWTGALSTTLQGTQYGVLDKDGHWGFGTVDPARRIDIVADNAQQFRIRNTEADTTLKNAYFQVGHYLNAEQDVLLCLAQSGSASNVMYFGGGSGALNAATRLSFYTAPNNITLTGTEWMRLNSDGELGIGDSLATNPAAQVNIQRNNASQAAALNLTNADTTQSTPTVYLDWRLARTGGTIKQAGRIEVVKDGTWADGPTSSAKMRFGVIEADVLAQDILVLDGAGFVGVNQASPALGLHVGANATSHALTGIDDALISGTVEIDGSLWVDGGPVHTNTNQGITFGPNQGFLDWSTIETLANTLVFGVGATSKSLILTTSTNRNKNHDHAAQAHPTIFWQSSTNPDTDNTEWLSVMYGSISTGKGSLALTPATYVHVGSTGTPGYADSDGDLYVYQELEVDGNANFDSNAYFRFAGLFIDDVQCLFGGSGDSAIEHDTTQTPDSWLFGVGSESNALIVCQKADMAYDFAHALQTNPTVWIQSANQSATEWLRIAYNAIEAGDAALDITAKATSTWQVSGSAAGTLELTVGAQNAGAGEGQLVLFADDQLSLDDGTCTITMDAGVITESGLASLSLTPSGAITLTPAVDSTWSLSGTSGSTLTLTVDAINAGAGAGHLRLTADDIVYLGDATGNPAITQQGSGAVSFSGITHVDSGDLRVDSAAGNPQVLWEEGGASRASALYNVSTDRFTISTSDPAGSDLYVSADNGNVVIYGDSTVEIQSEFGQQVVCSVDAVYVYSEMYAPDTSTWGMQTNAASLKTFTLDASNAHVSGTAKLVLDADDQISLGTDSGVRIGQGTHNVEIFTAGGLAIGMEESDAVEFYRDLTNNSGNWTVTAAAALYLVAADGTLALAGKEARLQGGDGGSSGGQGGLVSVLGGAAQGTGSPAGGAAVVAAGDGIASGTGGAASLAAGDGGATGHGGATTVSSGAGTDTKNGGALSVLAGNGGSNGGVGGSVAVNPGSGGGSDGDVKVGDLRGHVELGNTGGFIRQKTGRVLKRATSTGTASIATSTGIHAVTGTAGATLTLPAVANLEAGWMVIVQDEGGLAGTNNISLAAAGSENLRGTTSITVNYGRLVVYTDGADFYSVMVQ
jgi:hypothetical protein